MSQPVNKDNYYAQTNVQLFSHDDMIHETKTIDPYGVNRGTGILGRMTDVLTTHYGYNSHSFSVKKCSITLVGQPGKSKPHITVGRNGFPRIYLDSGVQDTVSKLHNITELGSGLFADTYSASMMESWGNSDLFSSLLDNVHTTITFPDNKLGNGLETIARIISTKDIRGVDVDTFYIGLDGE